MQNEKQNGIDGFKSILEKAIKGINHEIRQLVEQNVPEEGDFQKIYKRIANPGIQIPMSHFAISVIPPYVQSEENKHDRYIELVVYNIPNPYKCSTILRVGTKRDIMNMLTDDDLVHEMAESIPRMALNLDRT